MNRGNIHLVLYLIYQECKYLLKHLKCSKRVVATNNFEIEHLKYNLS